MCRLNIKSKALNFNIVLMNGGRKHYKVKNDSINIIKRRIAVINLFIDTNIWLAMFHLSKDDLKELNKLKELIGKEIKIYIPRCCSGVSEVDL